MITCRPNISFPLIKLSQYSTTPGLAHFHAVQGLYTYLLKTKSEGLYYWRPAPRSDRPSGNILQCHDNNNYQATDRMQTDPTHMRATVDSDFANDTQHRKSVTGISIKLAGAAIYYKTRFQPSVALSSTEAEFVAACDAAKAICM